MLLLLLHLLLLLLWLHLMLWLLVHLLLSCLRLDHGLRTHHLHEGILVVGHDTIGKLRLLLSHEGLQLLLVEANRQAELRHHGIPLLHLRLGAGWRLGLWLLLLWHLYSLLHLILLAEHVELLGCEVVKVEERTIVRLVEARHDCG